MSDWNDGRHLDVEDPVPLGRPARIAAAAPGSAGVAHPQQTRFGQAIEMEDSERAGSRRRGGDGVAGHRLTGCTQHVEHRATPGVAE
jgi:hypothetical protein